jgi:hypothetical protein
MLTGHIADVDLLWAAAITPRRQAEIAKHAASFIARLLPEKSAYTNTIRRS